MIWGEAELEKQVFNVNAISKMDAIFDFIRDSGRSVTFTEIHTGLGMPKSSAYRIISALIDLNYLIRKPDGRISLGMKLYALGSSASPDINIFNAAEPVLEELVKKTGLTTHLGILNDALVGVYLRKIDGIDIVISDTKVGDRIALHCSGAGKALVAWQQSDVFKQIIDNMDLKRFTPNTIIDTGRLVEDLRLSLKRGYTIDDEERSINIKGIGVPVMDWKGSVVGAISLGGITAQLVPERYDELSNILWEASRAISKHAGK